MKRLCIYFFYDRDGIVDDYIPVLLSELKKHCTEICVVVNGKITDASKDKIQPYIDKLLVRKNVGLDAMAYKHALIEYGFENLKNYDELLLTNFTYYGPFYPLSEVFDDMAKKDCDWWGLFKWPTPAPVIYHHIPSFFVVYRNSLVSNPIFKEYWDTMHEIKTYADSVTYHEQRQTPYYDSKGFKSAVWMENFEYQDYWNAFYPLRCIDKMIKNNRFPFIKRRNFFYEDFIYHYKEGTVNAVNFIKSNIPYDTKLIRENILRTEVQNYLEYNEKKIKHYRCWSKLHPSKKKRQDYKQKLANLSHHGEYSNFLKSI